jgi:hypothetical protein
VRAKNKRHVTLPSIRPVEIRALENPSLVAVSVKPNISIENQGSIPKKKVIAMSAINPKLIGANSSLI